LSTFKMWVYGVYMVPAVCLSPPRADPAQVALVGQRILARMNAEHQYNVLTLAPWCAHRNFGWHTALAAGLAWGGLPGTVLSLMSKCVARWVCCFDESVSWFSDITDFPSYVYGLFVFSEGFFLVLAHSSQSMHRFRCPGSSWVVSLCCSHAVVLVFLFTGSYALGYGTLGCWGVLVLAGAMLCTRL
jgi:hypothetical protein